MINKNNIKNFLGNIILNLKLVLYQNINLILLLISIKKNFVTEYLYFQQKITIAGLLYLGILRKVLKNSVILLKKIKFL